MLRLLLIILILSVADAATFTTIYQFGDSATTQTHPQGPLAKDSYGVLYGTTFAGNTFFSLSPPATAGGQWTGDGAIYVRWAGRWAVSPRCRSRTGGRDVWHYIKWRRIRPWYRLLYGSAWSARRQLD